MSREHGSEVPVHVEPVPEPQAVEAVTPPHLEAAPIVETEPVNPLIKSVEGVLAAGLEEAYRTMDPTAQESFKRSGETTAAAIAALLEQSTVPVQKIIKLILSWLEQLPHNNPYYLEQQSQIKANDILNFKSTSR